MTYLVGTDEAGYGPNLGPLVISATVWESPDGSRCEDLFRLLDGVVAATTAEAAAGPACVAIADSKVLYQSGKGLAALERGLLAALGLLGRRPRSWCAVWDAIAPGSAQARQAAPWYAGFDCAVPLDCGPAEIECCIAALRTGLDRAGVRLVDVRSRPVFEEEFNRLAAAQDSKGTVLSHATLALAAEAIGPLEHGPIAVVCDKHGGRDHYAELLGTHFPEPLIEICGEGRHRSVYRFGLAERRVEFRFQAKGESHLPTALASMASKYLRELAMRAFNAFWTERVPGLAPTAGYPVDARRFKAEIAAAQAELGIEDRMLWRIK